MGLDIDAVDQNGTTALMWACRHGNLELGKVLLETGAKTDIKDASGNTAEYYCSLGGDFIDRAGQGKLKKILSQINDSQE